MRGRSRSQSGGRGQPWRSRSRDRHGRNWSKDSRGGGGSSGGDRWHKGGGFKGGGKGGGKKGGKGDIKLQAPCIWIGGMPEDVTEREIERACSKYGTVRSIIVRHSQRDTFCFAWFTEISHAEEAIKGMDQTKAFGAPFIKVAAANKKLSDAPGQGSDHKDEKRDWDSGRDRRRPPSEPRNGDGQSRRRDRTPPRRSPTPVRRSSTNRPVRVYLSQLPRDMEDDELQDIATEYGKVLNHELHREGAYKCGWVEYASRTEAEEAVAELDDRRMDEWNMRLQAYMYPGGGEH